MEVMVRVEVERIEGKFASREAVEQGISELIPTGDQVSVEDSEYEILEVEVLEYVGSKTNKQKKIKNAAALVLENYYENRPKEPVKGLGTDAEMYVPPKTALEYAIEELGRAIRD